MIILGAMQSDWLIKSVIILMAGLKDVRGTIHTIGLTHAKHICESTCMLGHDGHTVHRVIGKFYLVIRSCNPPRNARTNLACK